MMIRDIFNRIFYLKKNVYVNYYNQNKETKTNQFKIFQIGK